MCGFQWRIWDRIIIYISVEKSKAQNSSKTHSRPQRSLFLAHLIWTWTCLSSRFHIMQHTSHLPCEPRVSLLYHQRLSGCYRSIRNPPGASVVHMNQNSRWTCCSSWAKQLTTGHLGQVSQSFPGTSQNVLKMRRGHCLRKFSQCKWGAIEIKTKDILNSSEMDIYNVPLWEKVADLKEKIMLTHTHLNLLRKILKELPPDQSKLTNSGSKLEYQTQALLLSSVQVS